MICACVLGRGGGLSCVSLAFQSGVCGSYHKEVIQGAEDCVGCSAGAPVTVLTLTHSNITRIGIIEPYAIVFKLPLPARFIIRVLFLSLDSVEC